MSCLWHPLGSSRAAAQRLREAPRQLVVVSGQLPQRGVRRQNSTLTPASFVETCPEPSCTCISMPSDLDIDHKSPLYNTVAPYTAHVVVKTGRSDWPSRFEDETSSAAMVKKAFSPRGPFYHPHRAVLVSASSQDANVENEEESVSVFPLTNTRYKLGGKAVDLEARVYNNTASEEQVYEYIRARILPQVTAADPMHSASRPSRLRSSVFICGHGNRDSRCGILGPLLQEEFKRTCDASGLACDIALITHVGGHKYAGNVIIYVAPSPDTTESDVSSSKVGSLAGKGVWYGRVEPRHVQGIVAETLTRGRIIAELFRGGVDQRGYPLDMPKGTLVSK